MASFFILRRRVAGLGQILLPQMAVAIVEVFAARHGLSDAVDPEGAEFAAQFAPSAECPAMPPEDQSERP